MTIADPTPHEPESQRGNTARETLWFTVRRHRDITVFGVTGQLDAANSGYLAETLTRFLHLREGLVVDLDALEFCSVAGVEFFTYFNRRCRGARCRWALVPGPSLHRLLQVSGVVLPAARSLDDAADLLTATSPHRPTLRVAT